MGPLLLALTLAQAPAFDAFLGAHPPKGTWVAVDPAHVPAEGTGADLAAFGRKAVLVGRLTAVVPTTMVVIDDAALAQAPNLADGLPRDAKVLALMASLSPGEWRLLGGPGLGLDVLRGEPRTILASLLPRPFRWERLHAHDDVTDLRETERLTLPERDAGGVRLRLRRDLELAVHPAGNPESRMFLAFDPVGPKDRTYGRLDTRAERDSAFGVPLRQTVPNRPKPGGVRFADPAYDAPVPLAGAATIREALARVSRATGRETLADSRVADLPLAVGGATARAGDLLGALALAVTGTYRGVGPGFVLTSDLTGLATRRALVARWAGAARATVREREAEWRRAVAASGGLRAVGYAPDAALRADEALQRRIDEAGGGETPDIPVRELPPAFAVALERRAAEFAQDARGPQIATDRVGISSRLSYEFVLPDGTVVEAGTVPEAPPTLSRPALPERPTPVVVPPVAMPSPGPSVVLVAESTAEAAEAIRTASTYGFRELWLETHDSAVLRAAVAGAGRPVRLVVRPWTAPVGARIEDPDRNLFGDRAAAVVAREVSTPGTRLLRPPAPPTPRGRDLVAPLDPDTEVRFKALAALAATPGLAGVVVLDAEPEGYDGGDGRVALDEATGMGYAGALRWAFAREKGVDPVDALARDGSLDVDLSQPFFRDRAPRAEGAARWREFRAEANRRAVESLLGSFGGVPTLVAARRGGVRYTAPPLLPWRPGEPLPTAGRPDPQDPPATAPPLRVEAAPDENGLRARLAHPETGHPERIALDLSDVPPAKWAGVLDRFLKRRV